MGSSFERKPRPLYFEHGSNFFQTLIAFVTLRDMTFIITCKIIRHFVPVIISMIPANKVNISKY